jgi:hypothetical protein
MSVAEEAEDLVAWARSARGQDAVVALPPETLANRLKRRPSAASRLGPAETHALQASVI